MSTATATAPTADLMTLAEAATYLNMADKSLRWLRYTEQGPRAAKIGGRVMYRRRDVDAWIDEQFAAAS